MQSTQAVGQIPRSGKRSVTAAIYLRVSTVDQGKRGFSLPEQRNACLEKAKTLAHSLESQSDSRLELETFEFVDTAGGDLIERPELTRAREFVRESRPDFFICLDPDRFSRATYQAILIANEIEAAGTRLEFVQHDYQATSEGRLFFTLRVAIAEYEKAKILERTSRGKRGKMAAGGVPHHIRAYGYDYIAEAERQIRQREGEEDLGALVPNSSEAAWVRQMFEWVVQEEIGSQMVAERLNQLAVPAKRGGAWRRHVVADILRNSIYVGELRLNRWDFTGLGGQLSLPPDKRSKKLTPQERPESEWVTVPVPPIVERELFERAQAILENMKRRASTRISPGRRGHLLSGLLTCGLCGAPVHYAWNNRVKGYLLRCANKYPLVRGLRVPSAVCSLVHLKAAPIEEEVWAKIKSWFFDPNLLQADLEREQAEPAGNQVEAEAKLAFLAEQVEEAKTRQSRVLYLVSKGVVHPEVAEAQLGEIKRHLDALEEEEGSILKRRSQATRAIGNINRVVDVVRRMKEGISDQIEEMNLEERQTLVRMLIGEVTVGGKGQVVVAPTL